MDPLIQHPEVSAYQVPTDFPESDGTLKWNSTTLILVELKAGDTRGLGYTYSSSSCTELIREALFPAVEGKTPLDTKLIWDSMVNAVRNYGRSGIASNAIAAIDVAVWDLKARMLNLPLVQLLGQVRAAVPVYGSGGFTSYSIEQLRKQLGTWVKEEGILRVKMKIGREPDQDLRRVAAVRDAIGELAELFVDANGAYSRKQALKLAVRFVESNVTWFEEPVVSDDLTGLRMIRDHAPNGMEIAAGEYGYDAFYFRRMLENGAVDVLQPDATRCEGVTGFLQAAALCEAFFVPLSAHTAPSLHAHLCCAVSPARHVEYFHDHARIEQLFFDGAAKPARGYLQPDLARPGLGLEFKRADAERFKL